jgi:hypothetical protein
MNKIFENDFNGVSDNKLRQVKEIIGGLSEDKLDTAKPGLLKDFQFEKVGIEQNENKFDKRIEIIRLDTGQAYGFNPGRQRQFGAVVYKIPIVNGQSGTFQLKPSKYFANRLVTEEINCDEKNIIFAIGTLNENQLLPKEAIEDVNNAKARILMLIDKNVTHLNQEIETYNQNLETLITQEIQKRKQFLNKLDEVVSEL